MTAVYVLRHPQTAWNAQSRYQGRLEAPLSREGRTQAKLLARAFAADPLDVVVSSPLSRALILGRDVAHAADAPLTIDNRLTELGQAPWEGLFVAQIRERYPDLWRQWHTEPERVHFPRGESLSAVLARAVSVVTDITTRYPYGNVALVTHSNVVQVLAAHALHLDLRHIHGITVENASVTTFCITEGAWTLLSLNVTSYVYRTPAASAAASQKC